jgi:hypothetical protein
MKMNRRSHVQASHRKSEARTGNRVCFVVGLPEDDGHILITVHDSELKVDPTDRVTPDSSRKVLEWFEPLAKTHRILFN